MSSWPDIARKTGGDDYAHRFAANFDKLAAQGQDVHGEATFVASLVAPGASILDAGCGTGRVASRLAELGYDVTGADIDDAMLAVARERSPEIEWHLGGLSAMDLGRQFDVVVMAGNVIPFVTDLPEAMVNVAGHAGGVVVCGFGSDRAHLPPGAPVVPLSTYDEACAAAGLVLVERWSTWDRQPFDDGGYAVSVHRRA
ncbi:MAG TPA: class I SAM-dependent methyltransferase [Nocardioidaceae bacterium]|nr:class I SAM-dependent methyltransferase [Nocardioidaceae bacterium]